MKIYFLIHDDYAAGGLQRSTLAAADCLAQSGHEIKIHCLKTLDGGLAGQRRDVVALVPEGSSKWGFWARVLRTLRRAIATELPDACIGMGLSTSILLVLATLGMRRPRLFGSERAYPPLTPAAWHWKALRRFAFFRLDMVICQTHQTADWYQESMGINRDRLAVIPNIIEAPDAESPQPPAELASLAGLPLVACVGRLEPQKGFDLALPIFAGIADQHPDVRFLIVGEGPKKAEYQALAHQLGVAEKLSFVPRLPKLDGLWPMVSVFLLTSRFEGIPNVLAEAMANGVPCVAFDCPTGPAELIENDDNGILVPLGDTDEATRRCVDLLNDPALGRRLGDNARQVASRYSKPAICALWNGLVVGRG